MNYYQASQLQKGGWHYTCTNDGKTWPVGYCAQHSGHASKEEAQDCYRMYLLDNYLQLRSMEIEGSQEPCRICGKMTNLVAEIATVTQYVLCEDHQTEEDVAKLFSSVGSIMSSY